MGKTNIAVISDIHMSNNAEYSWFKDEQGSNLIKLLNYVAEGSHFDELLILGDAFDLWLYPVDQSPYAFEEIVNTWSSTGVDVIDALKNCVKSLDNVYYINGNHDMEVSREQIESIQSGGKHIQWITSREYMQGFDNRLHVEHGHAVDMFNAQDLSTDTLNGLPLGYYITRLVATADDHSKKFLQLSDILSSFHREHLLGSNPHENKDNGMGKYLVHTIIDILKVDLLINGKVVTDETEFAFADPSKNVTIGQVKNSYHSLLDRWHTGSWEHLLDNMLVCARESGLDWYAKKLLNDVNPPQAVVFGHTHHREMKVYNNNHYGNDGCWCSSTKDNNPTSIKIEVSDDKIEIDYLNWS